MSFLWMCLSLLYAASFLLSGASSDDAVSLRCSQTVEVEVGDTAILNCSISYAAWEANCRGLNYFWHNTSGPNGSITCNGGSTEKKCEWDAQTYVSLTISKVAKEETYTIEIVMDCGMDKSSIKVQIKPSTSGTEQDTESTSPHVKPAVLSIFVTLLIAGILYFLFRNGRGRKMIKCIKKEKTHGHSGCMDTAGEGENSDCLTNSEISVEREN